MHGKIHQYVSRELILTEQYTSTLVIDYGSTGMWVYISECSMVTVTTEDILR